jgi:hypothetical protein
VDFLFFKKNSLRRIRSSGSLGNFERPLRTEESDFRKLTMPRTHQEQAPYQ